MRILALVSVFMVLAVASAQAADRLNPGERLLPGQRLTNGPYNLIMQNDGNLVLYLDRRPLWASGTDGIAVRDAIMQNDGNLVLYRHNGQPVWASNTAGRPGAYLQLQSDGNLVIYWTPPVQPIWATHTER